LDTYLDVIKALRATEAAFRNHVQETARNTHQLPAYKIQDWQLITSIQSGRPMLFNSKTGELLPIKVEVTV
jgi:hypothetical protein